MFQFLNLMLRGTNYLSCPYFFLQAIIHCVTEPAPLTDERQRPGRALLGAVRFAPKQ